MTTTPLLPEAQFGPAERLLQLVLGASAHLWHNRPGYALNGSWAPSRKGKALPTGAVPVKPGLFVPAAESLYSQLLDLHRLNPMLMAHLASYALVETEWRDLKVAAAALMLVQTRAGQPVHDDDGSVAFYDDDYRVIGEAMLLRYERKSTRMMTPKGVLRVAELLEQEGIATLNRAAGFADPASKNAPLGRWPKVASRWLAYREQNPMLLEGLVKAGYKETIKKIARKAGYKPQSPRFFEILGWKQKQANTGHREVGLDGLALQKRERFDQLSEEEICELIVTQRLSYKDAVGRLPAGLGLTPAIMVALLPSLSDRDLRLLTPTLEELGLMTEPSIRQRWEQAIAKSTDQRSLNIAKNVQSEALKEKLADAADNAARAAVAKATESVDLRVMFLIDKSGSMQGAIEQSKEALTRILAGFPQDKLHIAWFDTMGQVLVPKAPTRAAVQHLLAPLKAEGGTIHAAAVHALYLAGVRIPRTAKLIVIVVGDEAGESGEQFAATFAALGYQPAAIALLLAASARGNTVRGAATALRVPFAEVAADQFDDPYQVPRVLEALLAAPTLSAGVISHGFVERVMKTPLLTLAP